MKLWDVNLQVYKKTLSHIPLDVFCFHFLRMHHNYFSEGALKVCDSTIFFRKSSKYKQKIVLLVIYLLNCNSSKSFSSCWIRHQINWSSSFLTIQRLQEHLFFAQLVCFAMYFLKNHIVLHHGNNTFLFYFDTCFKFTLSTIISTMKKWLHLTWYVNYIIKQPFYVKRVTRSTNIFGT